MCHIAFGDRKGFYASNATYFCGFHLQKHPILKFLPAAESREIHPHVSVKAC